MFYIKTKKNTSSLTQKELRKELPTGKEFTPWGTEFNLN